MSEPTLHPNLAVIAAAYDNIVADFHRGMIDARTARSRIAQLEARDDDGVRWCIDPTSGSWARRTAFGDLELDPAPPTHGYATATAHDLSASTEVLNPADRVAYHIVADTALPGSLAGATRRLPTLPPATSQGRRPAWLTDRRSYLWAAAIGVLVVLVNVLR